MIVLENVPTQQLELDGGAPTVAAPTLARVLDGVEWSYSRRNLLEQCPRRYYFEYFGANSRYARNEPLKAELRRLKQLQSRYERAGEIVHLVIRSYFRRAQSGETFALPRMLSWARQLFEADIAFSRQAGSVTAPTPSKFPPALLSEYFHCDPDADAACAASLDTIDRSLRSFAESTVFARIRQTARHPQTGSELRFKLRMAGCRISGVVDLAANTKGMPGIVDWKTGQTTAGDDDSLQLAVYAIWGGRHFGCAPEDVRVFKAYLLPEKLIPFRSSSQALKLARARIVQDAERMAAVHHYGKQGVMRAFTACAQTRVCRLCRFRSVCPEGKEASDG